MVVLMRLLPVIIILLFSHDLYIYLCMNGIRYRISRCDTLQDPKFILIQHVCISVEREDNVGGQISHCIQLTGSQCMGKTMEESVDLAFSLMSGSIAESANKLMLPSTNIINSYYIPNL